MTMRKEITLPDSINLLISGLLFLGSLMLLGPGGAMPAHAEDASPAPIADFQLVSPSYAWVLIDGSLFITDNNGQNWNDITPVDASLVREAFFTDPVSGFAVSQSVDDQSQILKLSFHRTIDAGATWDTNQIAQFPFSDPEAAIAIIHAGFIDSQIGWIVLRQLTSSNFNVGTMYLTTDGGEIWEKRTAPLGEPAVFITPLLGYMAGGLNSARLFTTTDGGYSWSPETTITASEHVGLPNLTDPAAAILPVVTASTLQLFRSSAGSSQWEIISHEPISGYDGQVLFDNAAGNVLIYHNQHLTTYSIDTQTQSQTPFSPDSNLIQMDFADQVHGWALVNNANCTVHDMDSTCRSDLRLVSTLDGGSTWEFVNTPVVLRDTPPPLLMPKFSREAVEMLSRTAVLIGQGFDKCEVATASQLQVWKNQSPFSAVNLYIGGVSRGCSNTSLDQDLVESLAAQGWKFIPTWVGHQASCTHLNFPMSDNVNTAYQQGRDNAWDAARIAMKLGLSELDQSGTVIYYDLEAFDTSNLECRNAAKAFINGWVEQLHEYGVLAGVYGSVCASALNDFYYIDNPPDVIWPARWTTYQYLSDQGVYNLPCISNAQWGNTQRILQYSGPHVESWGGISMNVDLNAIEGIVSDITSVVGSPGAALENGSFESTLISPWETAAPAACATSIITNEPVAFSGNNLLALHKDPNDADCIGIRQPITTSLSTGDNYRFAVWARSSQADMLRSLDLVLTPQGGASESTVQPFSGITDEWVCLEISHTIQNNGHTSLVAGINLSDADGIDLYLDNAQLTRNTGKLCPNLLSPTSLTASDGHHPNIVTVEWDSVPMATFYKVYRSDTPGGTQTLLGRSTTTSFEDTSGEFNQEFYYTVKACNAGACSRDSNQDIGSFSSPFLEMYDGFETGTLEKWSGQPVSDALWVCLSGARTGNYGLCFNTTENSSAYVTHDLFSPSSTMNIQFSIDPNDMAVGDARIAIVSLIDHDALTPPAIIQIRNAGSGYQIRARILDDAGIYHDSAWAALPNTWSTIHLEWTATVGQAKSIMSFSGIRLWINNQLKIEMLNIINFSLKADAIRFGGEYYGSLNGPGGNIYLDDFSYTGTRYARPDSP